MKKSTVMKFTALLLFFCFTTTEIFWGTTYAMSRCEITSDSAKAVQGATDITWKYIGINPEKPLEDDGFDFDQVNSIPENSSQIAITGNLSAGYRIGSITYNGKELDFQFSENNSVIKYTVTIPDEVKENAKVEFTVTFYRAIRVDETQKQYLTLSQDNFTKYGLGDTVTPTELSYSPDLKAIKPDEFIYYEVYGQGRVYVNSNKYVLKVEEKRENSNILGLRVELPGITDLTQDSFLTVYNSGQKMAFALEDVNVTDGNLNIKFDNINKVALFRFEFAQIGKAKNGLYDTNTTYEIPLDNKDIISKQNNMVVIPLYYITDFRLHFTLKDTEGNWVQYILPQTFSVVPMFGQEINEDPFSDNIVTKTYETGTTTKITLSGETVTPVSANEITIDSDGYLKANKAGSGNTNISVQKKRFIFKAESYKDELKETVQTYTESWTLNYNIVAPATTQAPTTTQTTQTTQKPTTTQTTQAPTTTQTVQEPTTASTATEASYNISACNNLPTDIASKYMPGANVSTAKKGTSVTVTPSKAVPSEYDFEKIEVINKAGAVLKTQGTTEAFTFTMPASDVTIKQYYKIKAYSIMAKSNRGTDASCLPKISSSEAAKGTTIKVTPATIPTGYVFEKIVVSYGSTTKEYKNNEAFSFGMPGEAVTVTQYDRKVDYTITAIAGEEGHVPTVSKTTANIGDAITVTAAQTPGYKLSKLIVQDSTGKIIASITSGNTLTFTMPASNVTVTQNDSKIGYTIKATAGEGGHTPRVSNSNGTSGLQILGTIGDKITVTAVSTVGHKINRLYVINDTTKKEIASTTTGSTLDFTMPDSNVTVKQDDSLISYKISTAADPQDSKVFPVLPEGVSEATMGTKIGIAPGTEAGYEFNKFEVKNADGKAVAVTKTSNGEYYFNMPASDVTITQYNTKLYRITGIESNCVLKPACYPELNTYLKNEAKVILTFSDSGDFDSEWSYDETTWNKVINKTASFQMPSQDLILKIKYDLPESISIKQEEKTYYTYGKDWNVVNLDSIDKSGSLTITTKGGKTISYPLTDEKHVKLTETKGKEISQDGKSYVINTVTATYLDPTGTLSESAKTATFAYRIENKACVPKITYNNGKFELKTSANSSDNVSGNVKPAKIGYAITGIDKDSGINKTVTGTIDGCSGDVGFVEKYWDFSVKAWTIYSNDYEDTANAATLNDISIHPYYEGSDQILLSYSEDNSSDVTLGTVKGLLGNPTVTYQWKEGTFAGAEIIDNTSLRANKINETMTGTLVISTVQNEKEWKKEIPVTVYQWDKKISYAKAQVISNCEKATTRTNIENMDKIMVGNNICIFTDDDYEEYAVSVNGTILEKKDGKYSYNVQEKDADQMLKIEVHYYDEMQIAAAPDKKEYYYYEFDDAKTKMLDLSGTKIILADSKDETKQKIISMDSVEIETPLIELIDEDQTKTINLLYKNYKTSFAITVKGDLQKPDISYSIENAKVNCKVEDTASGLKKVSYTVDGKTEDVVITSDKICQFTVDLSSAKEKTISIEALDNNENKASKKVEFEIIGIPKLETPLIDMMVGDKKRIVLSNVAGDAQISYSVDDESVIKVSDDGEITALADESSTSTRYALVTIEYNQNGVQGTYNVRVSVKNETTGTPSVPTTEIPTTAATTTEPVNPNTTENAGGSNTTTEPVNPNTTENAGGSNTTTEPVNPNTTENAGGSNTTTEPVNPNTTENAGGSNTATEPVNPNTTENAGGSNTATEPVNPNTTENAGGSNTTTEPVNPNTTENAGGSNTTTEPVNSNTTENAGGSNTTTEPVNPNTTENAGGSNTATEPTNPGTPVTTERSNGKNSITQSPFAFRGVAAGGNQQKETSTTESTVKVVKPTTIKSVRKSKKVKNAYEIEMKKVKSATGYVIWISQKKNGKYYKIGYTKSTCYRFKKKQFLKFLKKNKIKKQTSYYVYAVTYNKNKNQKTFANPSKKVKFKVKW